MYNLSCQSTLEQGTFSFSKTAALPAASPFKGVTGQYPKTTHDGAVEQLKKEPRCVFFPLFSFLENINGDAGFACPAVCANGRTGKAGLAGGAGGSSPVSAQSTTEASDGSTDAPIPPKSPLRSAFLFQRTFYFFYFVK